jgi:hypothetical protein
MEQMENKMDENRDQMENNMDKNMEELQNFILQTLDGRIPKIETITKETHENKGSIHIEQPTNNNKFLGGFNSSSVVNYGWVSKGDKFPKVELKKFDGTQVFTCVNQIEKYFEFHNIIDDKERIYLATLYFEIKPYQWYQLVPKRKPNSYHYTWILFTRDLEAQYGKVSEQDYFSQLTRIKHLCDIED